PASAPSRRFCSGRPSIRAAHAAQRSKRPPPRPLTPLRYVRGSDISFRPTIPRRALYLQWTPRPRRARPMTTTNLSHFLRHLRALSEVHAARDLTDGELLVRFRAGREETAFAILMQRHGPMVLGVCRRLLADAHAAEDAFQATFLVLVRKAA